MCILQGNKPTNLGQLEANLFRKRLHLRCPCRRTQCRLNCASLASQRHSGKRVCAAKTGDKMVRFAVACELLSPCPSQSVHRSESVRHAGKKKQCLFLFPSHGTTVEAVGVEVSLDVRTGGFRGREATQAAGARSAAERAPAFPAAMSRLTVRQCVYDSRAPSSARKVRIWLCEHPRLERWRSSGPATTRTKEGKGAVRVLVPANARHEGNSFGHATSRQRFSSIWRAHYDPQLLEIVGGRP